MGDSHYFDNETFSHILKRTILVDSKTNPGVDISLNSSSIIYTYDPSTTPTAVSFTYDYTDISYIRFNNQIFSISGQEITQTIGKNVDVSLNQFVDGKYTSNISIMDISNVPFVGNYSLQTISGTPNIPVLDLFEYKPTSYTISTTNLDPNITYTVTYNSFTASYATNPPSDYIEFVYDTINKYWYISPETDPVTICSDPVPIYRYTRLQTYTYPDTNVNNIFSNRMISSGEYPNMVFSINNIAEKVKLPE